MHFVWQDQYSPIVHRKVQLIRLFFWADNKLILFLYEIMVYWVFSSE